MSQLLRQSTERIVRIGSFVDKTDGVTPETGVTLGAADQAEAMKAGGGNSVDIAAATWAAVTGADGWYDLTLSASFTDTVGDLTIVVQDADVCLPVMVRFTVVEEAVYDALYAGSAPGYGTAQTGDTYALAAGATGFTAIDTVVDAILLDTGTNGVVVAAGSKTGYTLAATTGLGNQTANITGNLSGSVGSVTGAVGSVTGAVGSVTAPVTTDAASRTASQADVSALATTVGMAAAFTEIKGATWASGTDTLEAIRDRGDAAWMTATGFMPSTEDGSSFTAIPDMATATTQAVIAGYIDTEVGAIVTALATAQADLDILTGTDGATLATAQANYAPATAAQVATALTTALTTTTMAEDYPADGAAATPAELLYLILSCVSQFDISGTVLTIRRLDGTTSAGTYTLTDADLPTGRVRAT